MWYLNLVCIDVYIKVRVWEGKKRREMKSKVKIFIYKCSKFLFSKVELIIWLIYFFNFKMFYDFCLLYIYDKYIF